MIQNNLENIMAYICQSYPFKDELSNARLTKLVYLVDWFHSVYTGQQATRVVWFFNHYGPYVEDVYNLANNSSYFDVEYSRNYYGDNKVIIHYNGPCVRLNVNTEKIIDFVINKTKFMYFNDFIDYVYSTFPIRGNNRYSELDLPRLAEEYKRL